MNNRNYHLHRISDTLVTFVDGLEEDRRLTHTQLLTIVLIYAVAHSLPPDLVRMLPPLPSNNSLVYCAPPFQ